VIILQNDFYFTLNMVRPIKILSKQRIKSNFFVNIEQKLVLLVSTVINTHYGFSELKTVSSLLLNAYVLII